MSELSPEAKRLFETARQAYSPSAQRLDAMQVALHGRIAADAAAASGASGASGAASAATGTAKVALAIKAAAVLGVATVAVVGASLLRAPEHAAEPASSSTTRSAPAPAPAAMPAPVAMPAPAMPAPAAMPAPDTAVPAPALPVAPSAEPARAAPQGGATIGDGRAAHSYGRPTAARRAARPNASSAPAQDVEPAPEPEPAPKPEPSSAPSKVIGDELDAEVRLLRAARAALESGAPERALSILDEHAAGHPRATLAQESLATRALALCALGRVSAARAVVHELSRLSPGSPHLARLRASCAGPAEQ